MVVPMYSPSAQMESLGEMAKTRMCTTDVRVASWISLCFLVVQRV